MHAQLERVLGPEAATTHLAHLPPSGWSDVATRRDLDELERRMTLRLDATEQRLLAVFRAELVTAITTQTRTMIFTMAGTVVSLAAVALAA